MFDVAALAAALALLNGSRVGIVTNAGGPAILCADACSAEGLSVPELADITKGRLSGFLPPHAALTNPVDMLAYASPEQVERTIAFLGDDPNNDAIVAIYMPVAEHNAETVAGAIANGARALGGRKPLLAVSMMSGELPARYAQWRARPRRAAGTFPDVRRDIAAAAEPHSDSRGRAEIRRLRSRDRASPVFPAD